MFNIKNKRYHFLEIIINHIKANIKSYIVVLLVFITGVFSGVFALNNARDDQKETVSTYINEYIYQVKNTKDINTSEALKNSIRDNIILAVVLWFAGTTLIGIPIVFGIIMFRGFCLGYTISACTYTFGVSKGMAFVLIALLLQNIIFIPAILAIGVSGTKLYKSIMKNKRKDNIKLEIIRHTMFSGLMLCVLIASAIVKNNVSGGMVETLIKYF